MEGKGKQGRSFWGGQTRGGRVASTPIGARPSGSSPGSQAPKWKCRKCRKLEKKGNEKEEDEKEEEDWDEEPEEDCDEEPVEPVEEEHCVSAADIKEIADAFDVHAVDMGAIAETMELAGKMATFKGGLMDSCAEVVRSDGARSRSAGDCQRPSIDPRNIEGVVRAALNSCDSFEAMVDQINSQLMNLQGGAVNLS